MLKTLFLYLEPRTITTSVYREEPPPELCDEIEHVKSQILEKLDDLQDLRTKLRAEYVPLTVCSHLEQCIKETEVNKHQRTPKGQSKMDNPEKLATYGTQGEEKQNNNTTHYMHWTLLYANKHK